MSDTPIVDRKAFAAFRSLGYYPEIILANEARELERMCEELAVETSAWIQASSVIAKVKAIGRVKAVLAKYQAMKESAE